jgi:hypothetical protein
MGRFHEPGFHEPRISPTVFFAISTSARAPDFATSEGRTESFSYMVESGHACDGPDLTTFSFRPDPVLAHPRQRL